MIPLIALFEKRCAASMSKVCFEVFVDVIKTSFCLTSFTSGRRPHNDLCLLLDNLPYLDLHS